MKDKKWIEIAGAVETHVDEDEFNNEFLKWFEAKGWALAGVVQELEYYLSYWEQK